ncbi:hypothetical protein GL218_05242 [Daldinia childiae]|uniref:uncharacterized protein n=1 Tax=Daldinia childiae TaxID=326645 RepID=UPI001447FCD6|nr:uncharacterized protein GL218_05242 [Daldinia childiae]KAF3058141.1 hypothetical protein GL218_05242 [Daldinia childiae]
MEPGRPLAPWEPLTNWYDTKLEDILPHHGFVFKEGHKIFKTKQDWVRVKWAIEAPAPTLEEEKVDAVLAGIMDDANIISNNFQQTYSASIDYSHFPTDAIIESARKEHGWTEIVPDGRFPLLMKKLIRARTLYNRITWILGRSEADKTVLRATTSISRSYMISRMVEGKGADWNFFKGDNPDYEFTNNPIGYGTSNYKKKKEYNNTLSDEDAPWVHTNYASNPEYTVESIEDEDDENAPWIPWSQTMRARQLIHEPTEEGQLLSYHS